MLPLVDWNTWLFAMIGSALVGLSGVVPVLACGTFFYGHDKKYRLKLLVSFAVGSILANIFLHILPECWNESRKCQLPFCMQGYVIITGIIGFAAIERLSVLQEYVINPAGYLNLIANVSDNFVHGLSVGSAFAINLKVGIITVLSIIAHEIPHEFSDFGLLLTCGLSVKEATLAQLLTSTSSMLGAATSLILCQTGRLSVLILLLTGGALLHLSLTHIFADLLREECCNECEPFKQIGSMICGAFLILLTSKLPVL